MTRTIKKLHRLRNAGVFADIAAGDGGPDFTKFNVVYGFNGCGKTTIARILDSINSQQLNPNLPEQITFTVQFDEGEEATESSLAVTSSGHLCVFCEDFVERALAWKDAKASPIIYIGEAQADIAEKLKSLEADEVQAVTEQTLHATEWGAADRAENQHCTNVARMISEELAIVRGYDARHLRNDYEGEFDPSDKLTDDERAELKRQILQLDPPEKLTEFSFELRPQDDLLGAKSTLGRQLEQIAIEALERRQDALPWVERGLELHEQEADCLFCGGELSQSRKSSLKEALEGAFKAFAAELQDARDRVQTISNAADEKLSRLKAPLPVVAELAERAEACRARLEQAIEMLRQFCEELLTLLKAKIEDPSSQHALAEDFDLNGVLGSIERSAADLNAVFAEHNTAVDGFEDAKAVRKNKLKRHFLADTKSEHQNLVALQNESKTKLDGSDTRLNALRSEIKSLRDQMREHGPAAERLNQLIASYLGHNRISILPDEEGYQICRDGSPSLKPLSEGEKTALAFC